MNIESAAVNILKRGVELDTKKRYTEALVCYQEGLQILVDKMKGEHDETTRTYLRRKVEEYMNRAEGIKKLVGKQKEEGKFHEQVNIENNSTGHSYKALFGRFLDDDVQFVLVEDPYIRSFHQNLYSSLAGIYDLPYLKAGLPVLLFQFGPVLKAAFMRKCQNFLRLCELLVKSCSNLRYIELLTSRDNKTEREQKEALSKMKADLTKYNVNLVIVYSETLHDRQITLSTGWIIKIGRGLDFYKAPENKFCLGANDMDLRPCHETTVDIVHSKNVKQSFG